MGWTIRLVIEEALLDANGDSKVLCEERFARSVPVANVNDVEIETC